MSAKVFDTIEVRDLLKAAANLGSQDGNARGKHIVHRLLNVLARHGDRPAHVHFFVTSDQHRKLTTQINIEGDPLIRDDFAYATREDLIPHVVEKNGGAALAMKADQYKDIEFNIELTPLVQGKDNQLVHRLRASASA